MRQYAIIVSIAATATVLASCSMLKKGEKKAPEPQPPIATATHEDHRMKLSKRILDGEWTIAEVNGSKVTGEERPYVTFSTVENRIYGSNGCNVINGDFQVEGNNGLSFENIITSMKACADAPFQYEITDGLGRVSSYSVEKRGHEYYLNLFNPSNHRIMTLRKHNMDYLNGAWRVASIGGRTVHGDDLHFVIDIPELRLHGNTGCNILNGTLSIDPDKSNSIQFQQLITTRMKGTDKEMEIERALLIALEEVESAKRGSRGVTMYDIHGREVLSLHKIDDK